MFRTCMDCFPAKIFRLPTSDLSEAVKKSLELRGDDATGWGLGWRLNLWARLHDGAHAYKILQNLLAPAKPEANSRERSGVYNNLFDAHPPFQIDGNFGGHGGHCRNAVAVDRSARGFAGTDRTAAGAAAAWQQGSATGLCARGGFEVKIRWRDGKLVGADITNKGARAQVNVAYADKLANLALESGATQSLDAQLSQVVAPH